MKNCLLIVFLLLTFLFPINSHAIKIMTESLEQAIDEIESTYMGVSDLTADFSQTTDLIMLNKKVSNIGTLSWKKPSKFFINYTGGKPKQYISDGKKMWIYVPGDRQVESHKLTDNNIPKEALEFMQGFINIRQNYRIVGWKKNGKLVEMTLSTLNTSAPYSRLKCKFRPDHLMDEVMITNKSGNISIYRFSNIRINTGLPDKFFKFQKSKKIREVH